MTSAGKSGGALVDAYISGSTGRLARSSQSRYTEPFISLALPPCNIVPDHAGCSEGSHSPAKYSLTRT